MTPFERRVLTLVSRIPIGRVTTYGDIARLAGRPGAARAVGNILRQADRPGLPYHRVIAAGGALGGYSSLPLKRSLLAAEGLTVTPRRVVGFAKIRWPASAREASYGEVTPKRQEKVRREGGKGK
jgi:O-6-methylguanine DNA methyltransferase